MTESSRQLSALEAAALTLLEPLYFDALTAQMRGLDGQAEWSAFRLLLTRSFVLANLIARAGALGVLRSQGMAVPIANPEFEAKDFQHYADEPASLLTRPFVDAINLFRAKIPRLSAVVDAVSVNARARAFWVTGIESIEALKKIRDRIALSLEGKPRVAVPAVGEVLDVQPGLASFIDFAQQEAAANLTRARLETVYRTNLSTAQALGRNAQLQEPDIVDATALWRLIEVHDNRTRGNPNGLYPDAGPHYQMSGFMERPNHPVWAAIGWPGPGGFNCRRTVAPVSWQRARDYGLTEGAGNVIAQGKLDAHNAERWEYIVSGAYPDQGFSGGKSSSPAAA